MIRNYLVVAWRNLFRNKAFSTINLLGLALGISCSLLIIMWVQDEKHIDAFHSNGKYLFQVYERNFYDGKVDASYTTQGLLAQELKKIIPEIQYASGFERAAAPGTQTTFRVGERVAKMDGYFAGEDFFSMFSYPLFIGNASVALQKPEAIAISRRMAVIFFGSPEKAVGQIIQYENKEDLVVTAIFEDIGTKSSKQFDFIRSWSAFVRDNKWVPNWANTSPATFVQLRKNADQENTEEKIKDFVQLYLPKRPGFYTELALQQYSEKYLHSSFENGTISGGRIMYVRLFTIIAVFILLIACINFMNLATARAVQRAKEIGVRKVMGANRILLIKQFIAEALFFSLFSTVIALLIAALLLPGFNQLTGKYLGLPVQYPMFWLMLSLTTLLTGFVAGSYPALFLSSLQPVKVLKTSLKFGYCAVFFRKSLVVFQFALSVILMVSVLVIYRQVDYIQSKNLGYDRQNLVYIPIEGNLSKNFDLFKDQAVKLPGVISLSKMRNSPTVIEHHTGSIEWPGKDPNVTVSFADAVVGYDFVQTMRLKLREGRDFSREYGRDSASFLLNETAVEKIGLDKPIGKTVIWGNKPGTIIGVLRDFHFNSMHQAIEPLIVRLDENWSWGTILVRIKAENTRQALTGLEALCSAVNPQFPFTYQFSDEEFSKLYLSEQVARKLSGYFAFLAIFISCLGLFGLAAFTTSQRKKEVGVRKVLGASVRNIIILLTTNFLKPVAFAILIAVPLSAIVMNRWLQNFAYRQEIDWWIFAAGGFAAIVIALVTVSVQAIRAAITNPVQSLKSE